MRLKAALEGGLFIVGERGEQIAAAASGAPLHHLDAAAGGLAEAWAFAAPDYAACPKAL